MTLWDRTKPGLPWTAWLLAAVLFSRLASLALYPVMDPSEGRYANIARVMVESGDWITPQNAPGVPFWGKPPLFAWASAASMGIVGVNELGARLPSFLFSALALLIVYSWAFGVATQRGHERPREAAAAAALVAATCLGFFVASGAVMTDPSLVLTTTWALASFWMATIRRDSRRRWQFGFFAAVGLGMLAKGPVILVLVAGPILVWCLIHRRWADLVGLPWRAGTVLAVVIAAPWYVVAELKTPGFLRYFILGENLQRFLVPGWKGDLYGFAHEVPFGVVWPYFAAATLPWSLLAIPAAGLALARVRRWASPDPEMSFLGLATLLPLAFFSFSSHVIWTYSLPSVLPAAVLVGTRLTARGARGAVVRTLAMAASAISILLAGSLVAMPATLTDRYTTRAIYREWEAARAIVPGPIVFEQHRVVPSLLFYSHGAAVAEVPDDDEMKTHYDVYTTEQFGRFAAQSPECTRARTVIRNFSHWVLVRETGLPQRCDIDF